MQILGETRALIGKKMKQQCMKHKIVILTLFVSLFVWTSCLRGRVEFSNPKIDDRIMDDAKLFSDQQKDSLFELIRKLDADIGSQIGIATTDSLKKGETIEDFSLKKVDEMRLGRKNYRDGILFAISKKDKRIRIDVGDGLTEIIPNDKARWINVELIIPKLKDGLYYEGLYNGVSYTKKEIESNKEKIGVWKKKKGK